MRNVSRSVARFVSSAILVSASVLSLESTALAGTTQVNEIANGVQYLYLASFAEDSQSAIGIPVTPETAKGKILELQSISLYRFPSSSSTLQCFLAVPATLASGAAAAGYIALPDTYPSSDFYPASTATLTAYVPAGKSAYVNCYRTGGSYPAETVYFTIVGVLTSP